MTAYGMRVVKSASGTTTVSVYSGSTIIAEYDNGAAPSAPSREFIYNPAGGDTTCLLAMISTTGCNSTAKRFNCMYMCRLKLAQSSSIRLLPAGPRTLCKRRGQPEEFRPVECRSNC